MAKPKLSVIVLNWNGKQFLEACFRSLAQQTYPRANFETLLVDNGSTDGSTAYVRTHFPWVNILSLPKNVGFAKGNNYGIHHAKGTWVLTLNNDTKLEKDCLAELMRQIAQGTKRRLDKPIGMYSIKMRFFYEPDELNSTGTLLYRDGAAMNRGMRENDEGQYDGPAQADIFGPCAGAGVYRREMLEAIAHRPKAVPGEPFMANVPEYFDAEFFIYLEDVDLIWRAQLAGWGARYVPRAMVYHVHSATMEAKSPKKLYLAERNRIWYTFKVFPLALFLTAPRYTLQRYLAVRKVRNAGDGGGTYSTGQLLWALARAWFDGIRGLPKFLAKRIEIQRKRKHSVAELREFFNRYGASAAQIAHA